jgi:phage gp45-like
MLVAIDALDLEASSYTEASWAALVQAREAAGAVLAALGSQTAIDQAFANLRTAMESLVEAPADSGSGAGEPSDEPSGEPSRPGDSASNPPPASPTPPAPSSTAVPPIGTEGTVVNAAVSRVKASQRSIRLALGKSVRLSAFGYRADGSRVKVTWKSSKPSVASVSSVGKISAKKQGKATITVTAGGKTSRIAVTVLAKGAKSAVTKVSVARLPRTMAAGQSVYLSASASPARAVGAKITYSSNKTAVATVDKAGRVQALAPGKAVITVKAGGKVKRTTVTVSK